MQCEVQCQLPEVPPLLTLCIRVGTCAQPVMDTWRHSGADDSAGRSQTVRVQKPSVSLAHGPSMEAPAPAVILWLHHGKITSRNPDWVWDPAMKNWGKIAEETLSEGVGCAGSKPRVLRGLWSCLSWRHQQWKCLLVGAWLPECSWMVRQGSFRTVLHKIIQTIALTSLYLNFVHQYPPPESSLWLAGVMGLYWPKNPPILKISLKVG